MRLEELSKELKARNAKVSGRKLDLPNLPKATSTNGLMA